MTFDEAMRILAAHGIVRATRDIDIFVNPGEDNIARLRDALKEVFDDPSIDEITAADLGGDYPAIQYVPPDGEYWIDILARLGDAVRHPEVECEILRIEGVAVRVATPRMLYRMKRDTVRPQDRLDAQVLKERFNLEDE